MGFVEETQVDMLLEIIPADCGKKIENLNIEEKEYFFINANNYIINILLWDQDDTFLS